MIIESKEDKKSSLFRYQIFTSDFIFSDWGWLGGFTLLLLYQGLFVNVFCQSFLLSLRYKTDPVQKPRTSGLLRSYLCTTVFRKASLKDIQTFYKNISTNESKGQFRIFLLLVGRNFRLTAFYADCCTKVRYCASQKFSA